MSEVQRESVQSFFHGWEHEFRRSPHPLAAALHSFVALADLQERSDAVNYLYSLSTFGLIDEAKALSSIATLKYGSKSVPRPVVRLRDVAATLLLRVRKDKQPSHDIEQRLGESLRSIAPSSELEQADKQLQEAKTKQTLDEKGWLLEPDLVDSCALAAFVLQKSTPGVVPKVELADFVMALLALPAGRKVVFEHLLASEMTTLEPIGTRFIKPLLGTVSSDSQRLWFELWDEIEMEGAQTSRQEESEPRIPEYVADRPIRRLRDDILQFRHDARGVAEIICQQEPGPPLAIGLFGDWGSGKSSFMNLLRLEIDHLVDQSKAFEGPSPFAKRIAHIWFNAWQYNDAKLWPALAENTFAQLRAGTKEDMNRQLSEEVMKELSRKVEDWEDIADELALELMATQHQGTEKRDELLKAADTRDNNLREAREAAIKKVDKHLQIQIRQPGEGTDTSAVAELIDKVDASTDTAHPTRQDLLRAIQIAWQLKGQRWPVLLGFSLLILAALWTWLYAEEFRNLLLGITPLAPLMGALAWFLRSSLPIMRTLSDYRSEKERAERNFSRAQHQTEVELARLQREISRKENEIRRKLSHAAQFKGRSPGQVLDFFLSEGAAVQALQDEVGVVSRVRRAFAQLNAVINRQGQVKDSAQKQQLPERIVFYIDDLDRCHAEQVVRVLEAVHLLLAFDRFIVVVGVDTRWLETSLMSFYKDQLRADLDVMPRGNGAMPDPRATVRDYVEKIFQIPIQIPRLTTGEEGTFAKLVDVLCPGVVASEEYRPDQTAGKVDLARYLQLTPIQPLDVSIPEPERFHEAIQRAQLLTGEVDLLKQLGPLAGRSPRGVKRLLNLYRLIRATRTGTRLNAFLQGDEITQGLPDYPGFQLCLAIQAGQPADQVHRFREAVIAAAETEDVIPSELVELPDSQNSEDEPWSRIMAKFYQAFSVEQSPEEVYELFRTIIDRFGDSNKRLQDLREILVETSRFSFSPLSEQIPLSGKERVELSNGNMQETSKE